LSWNEKEEEIEARLKIGKKVIDINRKYPKNTKTNAQRKF